MSSGAWMPPPAVLGLTAAVLAAHLWLLQSRPPRIQAAAAARPVPLSIRSIVTPPSPAVAPPTDAAADLRQRPGTMRRPAARLAAAVSAPASPLPQAPAAAAPAVPVSVSIPASMHLRYQVTGRVRQQTSQGTSELSWHHDGTSYEARFEFTTSSSRPRVQHSTGLVGGEGLQPGRFGDRGRGEQAAHFDREAQRVVFSNNRPAAPLLPGAQDRLSVLLQLAALVAGSPGKYLAGATLVIQTATTREAQAWAFAVDGEEHLQLPGGELATLKLTRPPLGEFDQRMEVWLAPGQAYAPVRLRLTQPNGDWADHQWLATDRR